LDRVLPIVALVLAGLGLLWFFIPILSGIPWVPTGEKRIRAALSLAGLQPGETFYDLGCGDGRVLIAAVRQHGAHAAGIEISPLHCLVARVRTLAAGVAGQTSVHWGNFYRMNLGAADVIYQYGHSRYAEKLKQQLERQLRDGTRVVSVNVELPGWQPQAVDRENLVFLYRMPPTPGDIASFMLHESTPEEKETPLPARRKGE
jgi:SAM-dependent methyltransferase